MGGLDLFGLLEGFGVEAVKALFNVGDFFEAIISEVTTAGIGAGERKFFSTLLDSFLLVYPRFN